MNRVIGLAAALAASVVLWGCDKAEELTSGALSCTGVCGNVQACSNAAPPKPKGLLAGTDTETGIGGADCAQNCAQTKNRALLGYSDCQMKCIEESSCDQINDCWKASSTRYAKYCIPAGQEPPKVELPASAPVEAKPTNDTVTGSEESDLIVEDPAVQEAVADNDFTVNFGNSPPPISGVFNVKGSIDKAENARPTGSPIDTTICFHDAKEESNGWNTSYCETGVPGDSRAPITGSGDSFTVYFNFPGQATILFSGMVERDGGGAVTAVKDVEALVVYLHAVNVWEHSFTAWTLKEATCTGCN
ncbi:MAG: hypothetical protein AMXMBFR64_58740 [Myxococcales bacterium]